VRSPEKLGSLNDGVAALRGDRLLSQAVGCARRRLRDHLSREVPQQQQGNVAPMSPSDAKQVLRSGLFRMTGTLPATYG
jgi:hypothetical protein